MANSFSAGGGNAFAGLTPKQIQAVQANQDWLREFGPNADYNLKAYILKYGIPDQSKGQHLTDEFKMPNHMTFSTDSIYSNPQQPGGKWENKNGKWYFYASPFNLRQHSPEELQTYFQQYEPDSVLVLPSSK